MSVEKWKDVPGYEGHYKISSCGRLTGQSGKIIKPMNSRKDGYLGYNLYKNGRSKVFFIHRLVVKVFIGIKTRRVWHIDGDRKNNNLNNLAFERSEYDLILGEEWRWVPGYEGAYQISDYGRVMSKKRLGGVILKDHTSGIGYRTVALCMHGKTKTKYIHRLVAAAFLGESELEVDHIDGDKSNNKIDNLEYVSRQENMRRYNLNRNNF